MLCSSGLSMTQSSIENFSSLQAAKMLNEEIGALVGGLRSSSDSSLQAFARMEERVLALEAEADASSQLVWPLLPPSGVFFGSRLPSVAPSFLGADDSHVQCSGLLPGNLSRRLVRHAIHTGQCLSLFVHGFLKEMSDCPAVITCSLAYEVASPSQPLAFAVC